MENRVVEFTVPLDSELSFQERLKLARRNAMAAVSGKVPIVKKAVIAKPKSTYESKPVFLRDKPVKKEKKDNADKGTRELKAQKERKTARESSRRHFKTRKLDLSDKIELRIDDKTIVYINPGDDPEAIKEKYRNRFKGTVDERLEQRLGHKYY